MLCIVGLTNIFAGNNCALLLLEVTDLQLRTKMTIKLEKVKNENCHVGH